MTQEIKTAIQTAEKRLETEQKEKLKQEVYDYLKLELETIDSIDFKIRKLNEEKRVHEANIKNLKQGDLAAIEKRRASLQGGSITVSNWPTWTLTNAYMSSNSIATYTSGSTVTTSFGKTYIF